MDKVLAPHNYDGLRAYQDLQALSLEERKRTFSKKLFVVALSGTLFSLYNVARFGRLSPSGRMAAPTALFIFGYMAYSSFNESHWFAGSSPFSLPTQQQESQQQQ